ncbi:hypothetical protein SYK_31960 [Pseudodesulfovibrio nedwellii]|uniref:Uncharacterized protein n=1 Tax=Pseudodesulfovibrio nedwellii TaxID=2973072 RepID=A0ABM8B508_9BACT|nr:hypothetical protein [Pseudodesulfovibrio nedwellii]BDQ38836.1 hypothetical protein SYK_31960 [Pseudodesulfovibrio nedwellii]
MQKTMNRRLCVLGLTGLLIMLAGITVAYAQPVKKTTDFACPNRAKPVGLVMDNRSNVYTACGQTGQIFCLPSGGEPIMYAQVEDTPTVLAVDSKQTLYVGTASGRVLAVTRNGSVREAYRCDGRIIGLSVDRDGGLVIGMGNGSVITVERKELTDSRK